MACSLIPGDSTPPPLGKVKPDAPLTARPNYLREHSAIIPEVTEIYAAYPPCLHEIPHLSKSLPHRRCRHPNPNLSPSHSPSPSPSPSHSHSHSHSPSSNQPESQPRSQPLGVSPKGWA